jgi:hypothetical protein
MAALVAKALSYTTGAVPAFGAATAAGDTVETPAGPGQVMLVYRNTNAATRNVTITSPGTNSYGQAKASAAYTLPALVGTNQPGELWIPLHPEQGNNGQIGVTLSTDVGVTVLAVKIA